MAEKILDRFYEPANLRQLLRNALGASEQDLDAIIEIIDLRGADIVPVLLDALAEEDIRLVRQRLLKILSALGKSAFEIASGYLDDDRWYFVRNLLLLLGESGQEGQVEKIGPLLDHQEVRVRRQAIEAVVKLGGGKAADLLLQAVDDNDEAVRLIAVHGLGFHRSASGVKRLRRLLRLSNYRGQNTSTIQVAAIALGRLAEPSSKARLTKLGRSPWFFARRRAAVQEACAWAISAIEGDHVGPPPEPRFLLGVCPAAVGAKDPAS